MIAASGFGENWTDVVRFRFTPRTLIR